MCIYNQKISCEHPECRGLFPSNQGLMTIDSVMIYKLYDLIQKQSNELQNIIEKNSLLNLSLENLSQRLSVAKREKEEHVLPQTQLDSGLNQILREESYEYSIILAECFPEIVFKEKGFQLIIGLVDMNQRRIHIPFEFKFKIDLYTMDSPARLLELNIHEKKILRGTIETTTLDNWTVIFSNIVINEVSSHYSNDSLRIIIHIPGSHIVKPLVINNVSVRARKSTLK